MDEIAAREKHTEELRAQNEEASEEMSLAEKKAAIRQAKRMYGSDWRKMIGGAVKGLGKLRVNKETLQDLHTMGFGGSELRDLNNPTKWRRR